MADTQILTVPQPKKEEKKYPQNILGGAMGWFNESLGETVNTIVRAPIVNEGPMVPPSYEASEPISSQVPEYVKRGLSSGEMGGFQIPRTIEDVQPEIARQWVKQMEAEEMAVYRKTLAEASKKEKREVINELNNFDPSYLRTMDEFGNVDAYHQNEADKKQVANVALKIRKERDEELAQLGAGRQDSTKGAVSGSGDLNTDFENRKVTWNAG